MARSPIAIIYDHVNARFLKYVQDGTESMLGVAAKLRNVAGTLVNPSTEDKQDDAITQLTSIAGEDFATETTLATMATEAKLELVRALLATIDADTSNLDVALSTRATEATLATRAAAATQTDGTQKAIARSGAKGTSTAADLTSEPIDANTEALHVDGSKVTQPVSAASLPLPTGAATEATQATLATEAKLEAVRVILASLDAKDYATQTTLAAILVDTGQIEALLGTIDADTSALAAVDYATQTTLAAILVDTGQIETLLTSLDGKDFATQTTLDLVRVAVQSLDTDFDVALSTRASESTVSSILTTQTDRSQAAQAIGDVAHGAADSGEPVKVGGTATALAPTAVDEGDRAQASYDLEGRARNRILQETRADPNNTTSANLASGATFTGTATEQIGYSAVHVSAYATQPLRIRFQQSTNGTDWNPGNVYYVPTGEVDTRHFQVSSGYYRLVVDNTGSISTTTLTVGATQVPVGSALPRALSTQGSLKVSLRDDEHDKVAGFSAFGVLKTANESILADYRFSAAVMADTNFLSVATTGASGYTIPTGGQGVSLNTGAAASSKIEVTSVLAPTYKAGRGQMHKLSAILGDTGVAGNVREWGVRTGNNGTYLRMNGATLQWVIENNGSETVFNSEDWDVPITPNDKGHLYYIQFEWLGVGNMYLYYDERVVHTYRFIGTSTILSMGTPDLGLWLKNENTSNATDVSLLLGCASTIMEGGTVISGIDNVGVVREVKVDENGAMNVIVTAPAKASELMINPKYQDSVGAIVAQQYRRVLDFTIPSEYSAYLIRFSSFQNEAGFSRLVSYIEMGTLEFIAGTYVAGSSYVAPQWTSLVSAEVTTALSGAGATSITVTVTYTNQYGTSGRTGTISIPKSSIVGSRWKMTLQAGDIGVRSVQNMTDDSPNAGAVKLFGFLELAFHNNQSSTLPIETIYPPGAIAFPPGTDIAIEFSGGTVSKDRILGALVQLVEEA